MSNRYFTFEGGEHIDGMLRQKPVKAPTTSLDFPYLLTPWGSDAYVAALNQLGIVSVTDAKGTIIHANDEFVRISGYERSELVGQNHRLLKSGQHAQDFYRNIYRTIASGKMWRGILKNQAKDARAYWVDALIVPLKDDNSRIAGYLSVQIDVTDAVGLHIECRERTSLLQSVLESFPGGISVFDKDMRMVLCNEKQKQLLEYPAELFAAGLPSFEDIVRFNASRGEYGPGDIETQIASRIELARQEKVHVYERQRPNGTHLEVRGIPLRDGGFVITYLDISERKHQQEAIHRFAHQDPLTGLPNRLVFQDRIRQGLARVRRGESLALLCLDLDRFKSVNDTLGHSIGDELLKAVAKRLTNCIRETDTVARLGGDEFAIIQSSPKCASDIAVLAKRIIAALSEPFKIRESIVNISASIGIAMAPSDGTDLEHLMQNADLALYRVKSMGRGAYGFFEAALQSQLSERNRIAFGLREALEDGHFELYYQPIVSVATRRIVGCESLIRWIHPTKGIIPASEFIPVAEEAGLIGRIGDWVLKTACQQAAQWPDDIWVSINISTAQLREHDFVDKVRSALGALAPSRIVLEITESMLLHDKTAAQTIIQRLRDVGVRFALDDFGTGFSSLSYLQIFYFDKIKIDRSFVSTAADIKRSAALRKTIFQLGRDLGMSTVAEGVETEEQFDCLKAEGCDEAQGYMFSKAIPASEISKMFRRDHLYGESIESNCNTTRMPASCSAL